MSRHTCFIALCIAALLVLVAAPFAGAQEQMDQRLQTLQKASRVFENGLQLYNQKNYEPARKAFEDALSIHPFYPEAELYLGMCNYDTGRYEEALVNIRKAGEKFLAWHSTAYEIELKQYDDSRIRLDRLKESYQSGQSSTTRSESGNSKQMDILKHEIDKLEAMKRPQPSEAVIPAEFKFHEGNCYLKMKKWNDALKAYEEAVQTDPKHGKAHNNLAFIYSLAKQYDKSWEHLQLAKANGVAVPQQIWDDIKSKAGK